MKHWKDNRLQRKKDGESRSYLSYVKKWKHIVFCGTPFKVSVTTMPALATVFRHPSIRYQILTRSLDILACYNRRSNLAAKYPSGLLILCPFTRSSVHQFPMPVPMPTLRPSSKALSARRSLLVVASRSSSGQRDQSQSPPTVPHAHS
jgi:hypothetical protein